MTYLVKDILEKSLAELNADTPENREIVSQFLLDNAWFGLEINRADFSIAEADAQLLTEKLKSFLSGPVGLTALQRCETDFQCSPKEMILRTDFENQVFQTCPNLCDWNTEVFKNQIYSSEPELIKEWSEKNEVPIHLAQTTIETKKY